MGGCLGLSLPVIIQISALVLFPFAGSVVYGGSEAQTSAEGSKGQVLAGLWEEADPQAFSFLYSQR